MRRVSALLSSVLLLFAAGCVEIEIHTKLNEDASGRQIWRFTGTALLASEIKKQVQNNPFFEKSVIRDAFREGDYILEATIDFQDVSKLKNSDRDVRFESEGVVVKTHTYSEVWKRSGQTSGLLAQHARGVIPVTLRVQVELPGRIVETNADWKEGSIARWSIPVSDLTETKMLVAKSRSWNWALLIPAVSFFAIIFLSVFFVAFRAMKKPRLPAGPSIDCVACGAKVPDGSTYCNFCGNRMDQKQSKA